MKDTNINVLFTIIHHDCSDKFYGLLDVSCAALHLELRGKDCSADTAAGWTHISEGGRFYLDAPAIVFTKQVVQPGTTP